MIKWSLDWKYLIFVKLLATTEMLSMWMYVCTQLPYFDCFTVPPSSFTTSCRRNWYQRTLVVMDCIFPMTWCRKPKVGCGHVCFILQYQSKFGGLICRTSSFSVLLYAPYDPVLNSPKIAGTFDKLQVAALIFAIFCCLRVICAALYFTQLSRHLHQNMLLSFMKLPFVA